MPWCPSCREEYREGYSICNDCGVELVNYLKPDEKQTNDAEYEREAYLTTVSDDIEAGVLESLLNSYDIPVLKKYKGAGGYLNIYMGFSNYGIDLFVSENQLEKAKEIIENENIEKLQEEIKEVEEVTEDINYDKKRRRRVWFIIAFCFLPALILSIYAVISYFLNK